MTVRQQLGMGVASLEEVRAALGVQRPASVPDLLRRYMLPVDFSADLVTPDGVALGGHYAIHLERNGTFRFTGDVRATGFQSFNYAVRITIGAELGTPAIMVASGRVHGTNEIGDRESDWDQSGVNNLLALHWLNFKHAQFNTEFNRDVSLFGNVGDVLTFVGELFGGFVVAGASGVCIMLGIAAADAAGLDEHVGVGGLVGVAVVGGILVVFGQSAIVAALVAGAAAGVAVDLLIKHRQMRDDEIEFANKVFRGTIPRDRVTLTNMLGVGNRPFTIPSIGDTILVNLGAGFDDPVHYAGFGDPDKPDIKQGAGQLFIHELTHVWQIDNSQFLPGLICEGLSLQATTLGGNMGIYRYGPAGPAFSTFNLEQQAKIVDQWFAGGGQQAVDDAGRIMGPAEESDRNPYFRYIRDNIRTRITS